MVRNLKVELMPYCFMCRRHVTWTAPGRFSCGHADPRPRQYNEPDGEHIDVYPPVRVLRTEHGWRVILSGMSHGGGGGAAAFQLRDVENPILYGLGKPCSDKSTHEPHGYNDPDTRVRYLCLGVGKVCSACGGTGDDEGIVYGWCNTCHGSGLL